MTPTGIEWTDEVWNPVVGCERVSPGCAHCYAKAIHDQRHAAHFAGKRMAPQYAVPFESVQLKPERLARPLAWRQPRRIFVNSVSDLFHEAVPDAFIEAVFGVMALAGQHTFQVLTKRPARMRAWVAAASLDGCLAEAVVRGLVPRRGPALRRLTVTPSWPLPNVWLGTSVENQRFADERIPLLLQTPAAVRWLSCEPLLGPVSLRVVGYAPSNRGFLDALTGTTEYAGVQGTPHAAPPLPPIDWVVVGGESGAGARPMHPQWARNLRDDCQSAGVPFFFKQHGDWAETQPVPGGDLGGDIRRDIVRIVHGPHGAAGHFRRGDALMRRVGKKRAGRVLDGRTWDEMPRLAVAGGTR